MLRVCMLLCVFTFGVEKRVSDPVGAGVTGGSESPYMALGTELRFFARAGRALSSWAISAP